MDHEMEIHRKSGYAKCRKCGHKVVQQTIMVTADDSRPVMWSLYNIVGSEYD